MLSHTLLTVSIVLGFIALCGYVVVDAMTQPAPADVIAAQLRALMPPQ